MVLIIHKTSVSPPARATMMVIDILGLKVETREVNLPSREQYKPDYLKKNPLHTVPSLEDGELVIADSHVITTYLVSAYGQGEHKLYPNKARAKAIVDQRLYFDATILFPRLRAVIYDVVKNRKSISNEHVNDILEAYGVTEKYLESSMYLAGDEMTLADISCVSTLSSLDCIVAIDKKYIKLHNWWHLLKKETWYQKENVDLFYQGNLVFKLIILSLDSIDRLHSHTPQQCKII